MKGVILLPEKDAEIMTPYEDYSVEELKEAYKKLFFLSDLNDADLEEMDTILALLQEKDPLPPTRSVDELREEFYSVYLENQAELGIRNNSDSEEVVNAGSEPGVIVEPPANVSALPSSPKRYRKLLRVGLVAAVLVAVLAAVTVTTAALGYDLWGWLPIWGEEELHFESETPRQEPTEVVLQNIPMVLASFGINEPLYPNWLPEDLARTEVQIIEDPLFLHEEFKGDDRHLTITISRTSGSETAVYQKEEDPPLEYIAGNNVVHYIIDNTNETTAVWYTKSYTTLIVGNIPLEEMKRVINSVYEVNE